MSRSIPIPTDLLENVSNDEQKCHVYVFFRESVWWEIPQPSARRVCPAGRTIRGPHGIFDSTVHTQGLREGDMETTGVGGNPKVVMIAVVWDR